MSDFTARIADLQDPSLSPRAIDKIHLMEASAGTGKTFSIQTIYLRLVLIEGLTIQQILTVTFTKDATKELRDRLQGILRDALDYLDGAKPNVEGRTQTIVDVAREHPDVGEGRIRQRLQVALLDFDMAAIYTMHGFCQRVLKRFAFETRQGFDIEPTTDADQEIEQLCRDWWRKNVYNMDPGIAGFLGASGRFSLQAVTELAKRLIAKPDAKVNGSGRPIDQSAACFASEIRAFIAKPPVPEEPTCYPNAYPAVHNAVCCLQDRIRRFRACATSNTADGISALLHICQFNRTLNIGIVDNAKAMKRACDGFMENVPAGTRATSFRFEDKALLSDACQSLTSQHTKPVREAAEGLASLEDVETQYHPFRIKQNASFDFYKVLVKHFCDIEETGAGEIFKAIRQVSRTEKCGIAEKAKYTVDDVNPEFREMHSSLVRLVGEATCSAALRIKAHYQENRSSARSASFNDYLVDLRRALCGNEELVGVLRSEFRAALIDEFQDTDPIQWGIFRRVFRDASVPCFLVGDPKQAIYRFRNGDVETYLGATKDVPESARYRLAVNFRSEKRLIDAVNQLFRDQETQPTFGEGIPFSPSQAPDEEEGKPKRELLVNGVVDDQPFKILLVRNCSRGKQLPGMQSRTAQFVYKLTAHEIARTLCDAHLSIGGKRVVAGDIAVLVRRHQEGAFIAAELKRLRIPSVRQGTGDVWRTDEGKNLWAMLEAILAPRSSSQVRAALISVWGGLVARQIQLLNEGEDVSPPYAEKDKTYRMENFVERFLDLNETWLKRGYPAMFRKLMAAFSLKRRLLADPDGEGQRRLANITHLSELIECRIVENRKTPEAILAWVRRQFQKETADGGDDAKLRLETDDNAVRIMTIFTSKGLQFPIVFAPTLFMMKDSQPGARLYEYHDDNGQLVIVQKTGDKAENEPHKERESKEVENELIRQVYVALTRGIHRTVVVALGSGSKVTGGRGGGAQQYKPIGAFGNLLRLPMSDDGAVSDDREQVSSRFRYSEGPPCAIAVQHANELVSPGRLPTADLADIRPMPRERPRVDTSRGHGSFSSIAPREQKKEEQPAQASATDVEVKDADAGTGQPEDAVAAVTAEGIFAFPSGARTGTCWHEIFENLDFTQSDDSAIEDIVEQKLGTYGFLKKEEHRRVRIDTTVEMVKRVLNALLREAGKDAPEFTFAKIAPRDRKPEWEFHFASLPGKRTQELREVIAGHPDYRRFVDALGEWDKEIPAGFLTGFVDLLFRQEGRYYIADWKSNRRSGRQADFNREGIEEEMSIHRYWLQYLIYTVAVHQYLSRALTDYNYERHFGGVYYVFLRGVDGKEEDGHTNGIYYDRPPKQLIEELSVILGDFA